MSSQRDIIGWMVDWMLSNQSAISQDLIADLEREARAEWGGREVRVWKTPHGRPGRPPRQAYDPAQAYVDGCSQAPTDDVIARHGISRSTLYRLVKRGPGEPD